MIREKFSLLDKTFFNIMNLNYNNINLNDDEKN